MGVSPRGEISEETYVRRDTHAVLLVAAVVAMVTVVAGGREWYVDVTGSDTAAGTSGDPFQTIDHALRSVQAGDTIIVGDGAYAETLQTVAPGLPSAPITLRAANPGGAVVTSSAEKVLRVYDPYYTIEGMVFDGQYGGHDIVKVYDGGGGLVFRGNEVRRGARDGIDLNAPAGVVIDGCTIHDLLWMDGGVRNDAHGIVTGGVAGLTVRDTEVYYVSGDCLQTAYGGWRDVLVEGCEFWNGPLPTARAGFPAGVNPGENAIDTKERADEPRATMTVRDSVFHGWRGDYISNAAALNLKQNCDVLVEGNTFYDNEFALRLRGAPDDAGAHVTVTNSVFHDNDWPIRYEDDIQQLRVYNNTFDDGPAAGEGLFQSPSYPPLDEGFLNNLFLLSGPLPPEAADPSNLGVSASAFLDAGGHDYRLAAGAAAIDAGTDLRADGVVSDRDGQPRPRSLAFDVGAHEAFYPPGAIGDANLDATVGIADLSAVADHYGDVGVGWTCGDFNGDGEVGIADLAAVADHYGDGNGGQSVPEPGALAFLLAAAVATPRRRRSSGRLAFWRR